MELDARDSYQNPPPGQQPLRVLAYRSDNAGELTSKQAVRSLQKAMIDHERTVPGSSQQNAHAEAAIKIVQDMARTLLDSAKLPLKYWPFAITCAVYVINRLPSTTNAGHKSRYEMFYGKKPNLSHLKTFGSVVTKFLPIKHRKHGDKQRPSGEGGGQYRLIGYPRKTKGYKVLDIDRKPYPMVSVCRNIHLQEDVEEFPSLSESESESSTSAGVSSSLSNIDSSYNSLATATEGTSEEEDSDITDKSIIPPDDTSDSDNQDGSTEPDSSDIEPIDNRRRTIVKARPRDTVNKIARRYRCDADLLCHVNHGVAETSNPKSALNPNDHLKRGTELFLPTKSDEERFLFKTTSSSATASSSDDDASDLAPAPPERFRWAGTMGAKILTSANNRAPAQPDRFRWVGTMGAKILTRSKITEPSKTSDALSEESEELKDNSPFKEQESKERDDSDGHPTYFENEQHWPDHDKGRTRSGRNFGKSSSSDSDSSSSDHSTQPAEGKAYSCLAMELDKAEEAFNLEMWLTSLRNTVAPASWCRCVRVLGWSTELWYFAI